MAAPKESDTVFVGITMDTETGGLDCTKCGVLQISMHAMRLDTLEVIDTLNIYIRPYNKRDDLGKPKRKTLKSKYEKDSGGELMEYNAGAEQVHGISLDFARENGVSPAEAGAMIIEFTQRNTLSKSNMGKPIFIGQNIPFDIGFFQQLGTYGEWWGDFCKVIRCHKDFWGNYQPDYIDTIDLGHMALAHDKTMTSYKLGLMAEKLGIELVDAHDADADVTATEEIARLLASRMRNANGNGDFQLTETKKEKTREHFKI